MSPEFAVPVKNIIKTWSRGSKLAKKFGKTASTVSAEEALDIAESVETLQKALERDSEAVAEVYKQCFELYGDPFAVVLVEDKEIQSRLKDLRADLMDQINEIQDVADEPEDFEVELFTTIQTESRTISENCIKVLKDARDSLARANLQGVERDDRSGLTSMRPREDSVSTVASFSTTAPSLRALTPATDMDPGPPPKPQGSWDIESPPPLYDPSRAQASSSRTRPILEEKPVSTNPDDFITGDLVDSRVKANNDFLERRKFARLAFNNEIRKSISSVDEDKESSFSDVVSPISPTIITPNEGRPVIEGRSSSSNDYPAFVNGQRGYFSPSDRKRTSTTSSQYTTSTTPGDRRSTSSHSNTTEDDLFRRTSNAGSVKTSAPLAATLKIPGYGEGVQDGLIVVEGPPAPIDYDNEKEIVPQNDPHYHSSTTPASSMKSIDSPMRHDSSFYKFGGFCDGAITALRGELGYKVVKRPSVGGTYGSNDFSRCLKCAYEVSMNSVGKDLRMDATGIYGNNGIRWRQQFLTKSHVKTSSPDEPLYACVFCIEDRKTTDEHDATVFFSHTQLFQHIAKHPRPLSSVAGINALYGKIDPAIVKFDLHFIKMDPSLGKYHMMEIAPLVQVRASASAIVTYHPNNSRTGGKDPDGNPTLHFAEGARIVGVTFPEQFNGAWCTGYHDGSKGSFPSAAITLDLPAKEDILMSAQSSLVSVAKWDFKPKDAKEGGWLKFSRGDKITHIGYTFQDQWCWSGQTKNGKWGLFPMAFVDGVQDGGGMMASNMSSSASVKSKSGMMSLRKLTRTGTFPSRSGRSGSVKSPSTKVPSLTTQPGFEVVVNGVIM